MFRRLSAFCIPMLLLLWLLTGEMQAQVPGCRTVDCDPPVSSYRSSFLYPFGGPGCYLVVDIEVRECLGRREITFDNIVAYSSCCDTEFDAKAVGALVKDLRDYIFANFGAIAGNGVVNRVVHPSCWDKNNTTRTAQACTDNLCCYIQGAPGGAAGAPVQIGVPPVPPCALPACTYICQ